MSMKSARLTMPDGSIEATFDQIARGLAGEVGLPGIEHRGLRQIPVHLQFPLERSLNEGVEQGVRLA